jgi:hypothetical protein
VNFTSNTKKAIATRSRAAPAQLIDRTARDDKPSTNPATPGKISPGETNIDPQNAQHQENESDIRIRDEREDLFSPTQVKITKAGARELKSLLEAGKALDVAAVQFLNQLQLIIGL